MQYRNLKVAYVHYRALAADSTIPTVTAPRVVRPDDVFAGVDALRRRLAVFGDLPSAAGVVSPNADTTYDRIVAGGVARFQSRHGLPVDSVLGRATLAAINVPLATRLRQLELALERIRWLSALDAGPFVIVNVPGFQLYAFDTLGTDGNRP